MNKAQAFKNAKTIFPLLKPTRASMYTGKGVIISGHDESVTMVLYHPTDLYRLKLVIDAALDRAERTRHGHT